MFLSRVFNGDFREILASQLVSIAGGMIAGIALVFFTGKLYLLPGILIVIPGFFEMRGAISGSFSSRLSSGLFLGVINPKKLNTDLIHANLIASFALAIFVSLVLGVIACVFTYFISGIFFPELIAVTLLAGIISNSIEIPIALFATFYLFREGHDPNNIMGPFITSVGDVVGIISLAVAMVVL